MIPKAQATKEKIDKLDIRIKNSYATKDTIKKVKRQPTEWQKIFAIQVSDKGFMFRKYKEYLQVNNKKTNNPI